jgi:hypothetical protein
VSIKRLLFIIAVVLLVVLFFADRSMPFTFHGFGTAKYGEKDYWPDGSYVTTEWIVFAFVPISPILSKRLRSTNQGKPYAVRDSSGYYVYETTSPNRKQILSVYG